jgi:hypothetical protein
VPFGVAGAPVEAKRVFDQVKEVLGSACPAAGEAELEDATDAAWATVHGFITLEMTRPHRWRPPPRRATLQTRRRGPGDQYRRRPGGI